MKSIGYCILGTVVAFLAVWYSFFVPWALLFMDMSEDSFILKVPVLLWQGCLYDKSCIVTSLVDTSAYPSLSFDNAILEIFSNTLLIVSSFNFLGVLFSVVACFVHFLDLYKFRMMHSTLRFIYPAAVGCYLLSLMILFPTLVFFMQGGFFLSGYVS